jgi:hypothetical protein
MERSRLRTRSHRVRIRLAFLAALSLLSPAVRGEECPAPAQAGSKLPTAAPKTAEAPGFKAVIDPATGQLIVPAPAAKGPAAAQAPAAVAPSSVSTSHAGLVAVPVTTKAGGKMVDLKGRFRSSVVATVGPDGKTTTRCVETAVPPAPEPPDAR